MEAIALPADVAARFELLTGHNAGEYHWNGYQVNLGTISAETAERLVAAGFPYLLPVAPAAPIVAEPIAEPKVESKKPKAEEQASD